MESEFSLVDYDSYLEKNPDHQELGRSLLYLFDAYAGDLGVESPDDPVFVDFAGDRMYDCQVPDKLRQRVKAWLASTGGRGEFRG